MSEEHVQAAISQDVSRGILLAQHVRILELTEGISYQALSVGSFAGEDPILDVLHHTVIPSNNATFNGHHHDELSQ